MSLRFLAIGFFLLFLTACTDLSFDNPTDPRNVSHPGNIAYTSFTDARDGKVYKSVVINGQTWMAENLNYNASGSYCVDLVKGVGKDINSYAQVKYITDTIVSNGGYCDIYGRLYDWETARNVCPSGWHLPSKAEWNKLLNFASYPVWKNLKSKQGWEKDSLGTDAYGFTAIPTIPQHKENFIWVEPVAGKGIWWSVTDTIVRYPYAWVASTDTSSTHLTYISGSISVRCIKDELCGSQPFNGGTQICNNGVIYGVCGGKTHDPENQRCNNNVIETKCGNNEWYNAANANLKCESNIVKIQCGNEWQGPYDPKTVYCNGSILKSYGSFTDTRDEQTYKTVELGTQVWMAENLNYFMSGYSYGNHPYGVLYNYRYNYASICPSGWHLPSEDEWKTLINFVGGSSTAGKYLKATSGWNSDDEGNSGNGMDYYGFSALPGGYCYESYNMECNFGYRGEWLSSSGDVTKGTPTTLNMWYGESASLSSGGSKYYYSVRCLKS